MNGNKALGGNANIGRGKLFRKSLSKIEGSVLIGKKKKGIKIQAKILPGLVESLKVDESVVRMFSTLELRQGINFESFVDEDADYQDVEEKSEQWRVCAYALLSNLSIKGQTMWFTLIDKDVDLYEMFVTFKDVTLSLLENINDNASQIVVDFFSKDVSLFKVNDENGVRVYEEEDKDCCDESSEEGLQDGCDHAPSEWQDCDICCTQHLHECDSEDHLMRYGQCVNCGSTQEQNMIKLVEDQVCDNESVDRIGFDQEDDDLLIDRVQTTQEMKDKISESKRDVRHPGPIRVISRVIRYANDGMRKIVQSKINVELEGNEELRFSLPMFLSPNIRVATQRFRVYIDIGGMAKFIQVGDRKNNAVGGAEVFFSATLPLRSVQCKIGGKVKGFFLATFVVEGNVKNNVGQGRKVPGGVQVKIDNAIKAVQGNHDSQNRNKGSRGTFWGTVKNEQIGKKAYVLKSGGKKEVDSSRLFKSKSSEKIPKKSSNLVKSNRVNNAAVRQQLTRSGFVRSETRKNPGLITGKQKDDDKQSVGLNAIVDSSDRRVKLACVVEKSV